LLRKFCEGQADIKALRVGIIRAQLAVDRIVSPTTIANEAKQSSLFAN
jgi:hypothetical protein